MIKVRVRLFGILKGFAGKKQLSIELEQATVGKLIQTLVESLPDEARKLVIDPELNDPRPNSLILLNGKEINVLNGLETEIREGDEITLVPVSHGG